MKIITTSVIYNEELLLPFFLNHYSFSNKIILLIDSMTNDRSLKIINLFKKSRVQMEFITFPNNKFDDRDKLREIHSRIREENFDWFISVDCDEFIFPENLNENIKDFLLREKNKESEIIFSNLFHPYRNIKDKDLDYKDPNIFQRRYGVKPGLCSENEYCKPIIINSKIKKVVEWELGCHNIKKINNYKISENILSGSHWKMADPIIGMNRRLNRKNRFGKFNFKSGNGKQDFKITEKEILEECEKHLYDERIF